MIFLVTFLSGISVTSFLLWATAILKEKVFLWKFSGRGKQKPVLSLLRQAFSPVSHLRWTILQEYKRKIEEYLKLADVPQSLDFTVLLGLQVIGAALVVFMFLIGLAEPLILLALLGAVLFLPLLWLKSEVRKKHRSIFRALPEVLDLLVLMMSAGLDFNAALNKYLEKRGTIAKGKKNPLVEELFLVQQEIRMGKTRAEALNAMAERVNYPVLSSVVSSIVQSMKLGSSLGPILKAVSAQLRVERFQLAEKLAQEAPIKMLFPLLFFIFPTIFIVLFGPLVLQLMNGF